MRLKKLELHGFKTFASRATLEFAPGITAIVGPNGSGKSNVTDAVRWVLGEQSLKLLRGRKSEDVIFAGGQGRAPMGLAEVTLTLDNADGALPPEYTEVSISRRAYRSGESEYYLNRSRVRLRDVIDLLSRAGVGQNGHSVVGQGMVDLALSLRPEERRVLFEDAAGMRRYHAKKAEAESKLAEVAANATRVADLIAELEPRVVQLQRQARRAQDESRLRQQWRQALEVLLAQQRWEIEHGLSQTEPDAQRLEVEHDAAQCEAERTTSAMLDAREQLNRARATLGDLQRERGRAREAMEVARREAAVSAERRTAGARTVVDLETQESRLHARVAETERARPAAERERQTAQAAVDRTRAEVQSALQALSSGANQDERPSGQQLAQARATLAERARLLTQITTQLRESERRLSELNKQALESGDGRRRAEESLAVLQRNAHALEQALAQAQLRQTSLQAEMAAHGKAGEAVVRRVQQCAERLSQNEKEAQTLRVRLSVLRDVTRVAEKNNAAPASLGNALAEQLAISAEFEAAVAAALGDALRWIILETRDEAAEVALDHARKRGQRATFVPKEALRSAVSPPIPHLPEHEGGIGFLSSLTADSGAPDLLAALVVNTYVVKDLASALALAKCLDGRPRPPIVTLAGELVDSRGAITSGAPPDETSMLQRLREIREIESELAVLEQTHQPLLEALTKARQEQADLLERERQLERDGRAALQEISRLTGEQRGLTQQRLRLEKDQGWWVDFAQRAAAQLDELEDRLSWLAEQRAQAEEAHRSAEAEVQRLTREDEQQRASIAALRERVSSAKMAEAVAAQRLDQATRNEASAHHTAATAIQELKSVRSRLEEARQNVQALTERATRATATAAEHEAHLVQADRRVAEAHANVQSFEAAIERYRTLAEAAQARASKAERDATLLQAQRATLAERLRALQEQGDRELGELPAAVSREASVEALRAKVDALNTRLRNLGPVNQVAMQEHEEAKERLEFLRLQLSDLGDATSSLETVRAELDAGLDRDFGSTFRTVAEHFQVYFRRLFGGGDAQLVLTNPANLGDTGIDIIAQLPGKRRQELASFSGGERALVAASLLFALLKTRPSPFCVLDEVDAALDEANVGRFCDTLTELSAQTQFVLVTHNRATMERAGALYGVTLGSDSVSRVVSLKVHDVPLPVHPPDAYEHLATPALAARVN